jgi:hypothetical protein
VQLVSLFFVASPPVFSHLKIKISTVEDFLSMLSA